MKGTIIKSVLVLIITNTVDNGGKGEMQLIKEMAIVSLIIIKNPKDVDTSVPSLMRDTVGRLHLKRMTSWSINDFTSLQRIKSL